MGVKKFIWDELSDNVLLETDENDVVTAAYHHRPEQFGELISQNRSGVDRFFHFDGNHSTSDLTASNQKVTDTFSFTAYGEEVARTGTTTNPFGYKGAVGYYSNSDTDDIYVRARTYQPVIGRWLSMDPLGFIDGPNLYQAYFVPNGTDPSGTDIIIEPIPEWERLGRLRCDSLGYIRWRFRISKRAPCDGYLVQLIEQYCVEKPCEDCPDLDITDTKPTLVLESWPVTAGAEYEDNTDPDDFFSFTDLFGHKFEDKTCGRLRIKGTVRFFCKENVNMDGWLVRPFEKPYGLPNTSCAFNTGTLPSKEFPNEAALPGWWKTGGVRGEGIHEFGAFWKCCDCDEKFAVAVGYPNNSGSPSDKPPG